MTKSTLLFLIALLAVLSGCKKTDDTPVPVPVPTDTTFFAKGADVGWLTQMESEGVKFYDNNGNETECLVLLKSKGVNSIRIRAWVNPADQWNNTADVLVKALRAHALGLKVMIDFHYSDTWADPGTQTKPAAWANLTFDSMKLSLVAYTKGVMDTLVNAGVTPDWVQIGNETNNGMLWEDGKASTHMANFAALVKAGYDAVKSVSPSSQVIVHASNGYDNALFRWLFDGLKANGAKWDIIGMSLYPSYSSSSWSTVNGQCLLNMGDMVTRYGTPVMIVEVGMPVGDPGTANSFLVDLIKKTKSVTGHKGLGVFYWEPECYNDWSGYKLGAFDSNGMPTAALDAFRP